MNLIGLIKEDYLPQPISPQDIHIHVDSAFSPQSWQYDKDLILALRCLENTVDVIWGQLTLIRGRRKNSRPRPSKGFQTPLGPS